ncbi:MAG TPA: dihydropteroate synthase, partial [Anaerolineae bacterium]|nr:dihydropteroate synthase [Anaerolineae bacterium]
MYIIGENIQILAPKIKAAIADRDATYVRELARTQVDHGANMLDLNIGPRKRDGIEVMQWMIEEVYDEVGNVPLSLDTTNASAIEAGLKKCKELGIEAMINSTSADPDRLNTTMPMAAEYGSKIIALSMDKNIPATADGRVALAMEILVPKAEELGIPMENIYLDPLVLTVNGCQEHGPETLNAIRSFKMLWDPSPMTTVGLSNISNSVPHEGRSLINRTFLVMLMAAGLDSAIADPLDMAQNEVIRIVEERDDSTGIGKALLALYD